MRPAAWIWQRRGHRPLSSQRHGRRLLSTRSPPYASDIRRSKGMLWMRGVLTAPSLPALSLLHRRCRPLEGEAVGARSGSHDLTACESGHPEWRASSSSVQPDVVPQRSKADAQVRCGRSRATGYVEVGGGGSSRSAAAMGEDMEEAKALMFAVLSCTFCHDVDAAGSPHASHDCNLASDPLKNAYESVAREVIRRIAKAAVEAALTASFTALL
uniref:Uncharacterized protein n=1 Tax=Oryza punctata TaxID=4537 RepID=A0A0E0LMQ0_ORYPU